MHENKLQNHDDHINPNFFYCNHTNSSFSMDNQDHHNHTDQSNVLSLHYDHLYSMITVALILGIIVFLMIVGNILVIASLIKFKNLRSVSNFLIGNLAASDFLLAVTILPFSIFNECLGRWVRRWWWASKSKFVSSNGVLKMMSKTYKLLIIVIHTMAIRHLNNGSSDLKLFFVKKTMIKKISLGWAGLKHGVQNRWVNELKWIFVNEEF